MKIIIVGGGKVGTTILQDLAAENHDVVIIDSNPAVIEQISNVYDVMCVCGNGVDNETLEEAGAKEAELLVSVTGSDEFNMLCCFMAKRLGTKQTIARIRNPEYNDRSLGFIRQQLELSMAINPDALAAREIFNRLRLPGAANVETFSRRSFEIVEIVLKKGTKLHGMNLIEMRKKFPASYLVGTVSRDGVAYIPDGRFTLSEGDRIGLTGTQMEVVKLLKMLGEGQERLRNVMIIGAGRTSFYLAKLLLAEGNHVTVVDKNAAVCESFAEALPEAVVIHGDAASEELLLEEGLPEMDAFVTLTGIDEENILLSYLAESHGVSKVITKINREEFSVMAGKLGLESTISPKKLMSDVLTRYARALHNSLGSPVETLYKLMDGKAEALEFKVVGSHAFTDTPLKDLKLKKNTLVAGILRGKRVIIPSGNDVILAGDSVVVLTAGHKMNDLADIME